MTRIGSLFVLFMSTAAQLLLGVRILIAAAPPPFAPLEAEYQDKFSIGDTAGLSGMIVFSAAVDGYERLFVLDLDGKRVRKLVDGPGNSSYPGWSKDAAKVSFTSDRDGKKEIYLSAWDGSNQTRLTTSTFGSDNAAWCKDGELVYYSETDKAGGTANLFMLEPGAKAPVQITKFTGRNTTPRCSQDGKLIAYSTNRFWPGWDICLWNIAEKRERCVLTGASSYCRPRYAPAGDTLAYSAGPFNEIDLALLGLGNDTKTTITDMPGKEYDITWSPDGTRIAFTAENGRAETFNIFILDLPKSKPRPLLTSDYSLRYLDWTAVRAMDLEVKRMREEQAREEGTAVGAGEKAQ